MTKLTRLVYPVFEVRNIERWRSFAHEMYGLPLQSADDHQEMVIDESGCRLIFREGRANDIVALGWETIDLGGLFDRLASEGKNPEWAASAKAARRGTERMFTVSDPDGLLVEVLSSSTSYNSYLPSEHGLNFAAGDLGFGHVTLMSKNYEDVEAFYRDLMGLGVSDYIDWEVVDRYALHIGFFHANARHHSMAIGRMPLFPKRIHHFMLEVSDKHQVGTSFDRIRKAGIKVKNEIGVHPNDRSFSFYVKNPSGFESELGAEGLQVDVDDREREIGHFDQLSVWGHKMSYVDTLPLKAIGTLLKWKDRLTDS